MLEQSVKEYYTIQELAEKWDYSYDDVLHVMLTNKLFPSFYLDKIICKSAQWGSDNCIERVGSCDGLYSPLTKEWNYNQSFASTKAKWELDLQYSRLSYGPPKLPNIDATEEFDMYSPINPTIVNIDDILIMNKEVRRFETILLKTVLLDHDNNDQAHAKPQEEPQEKPFKESSRAIENLQKIVVALAIDKYGYDPAIKGSSTVKDILTALDNVEVTISENTIRTHLKAGAINIRSHSKD